MDGASDPFVDANVMVRLVTGDDPLKQTQAKRLFDAVEVGDAMYRRP